MNCDIEIEVSRGSIPGEYRVHVVHSAAGGEPEAVLNLDVDAILGQRSLLENTLLASATSARRAVLPSERTVRDVGQQLFEGLFSGPVHGAYYASLGVAQQTGERLRVVLRLAAPELAALPWEMLYDEERSTYLCRQEPLVRRVPAPFAIDPLEIETPLRVLGLIASPRGWPALDVVREMRQLEAALAGPIADGLVSLTWVEQATWESVHEQLLSGEWHVVHFIGHGDYDDRMEEGVLAFVGADGRAHMVDAGTLADLLGEAEPSPRLVVLNSCSGAEVGADSLLSSTAAALVHSGIGAVAAMQFAVSDDAAIAFSRGFYTAIACGRGVDAAARSGRIAILRSPGTLEWATPVLYLRGGVTHPISIKPGKTEVDTDLPELEAMYDESLTALQQGHREDAIRQLDELLERRPGYRDASTLREAARDADESEKLYEAARTQLDQGNFEESIAILDVLLGTDPEYRDAGMLRGQASRQLRAQMLYRRASAELDAKNYAAAATLFDELLQESPDFGDAVAKRETARRQLERRSRPSWRARIGQLFRQRRVVVVAVILIVLAAAGIAIMALNGDGEDELVVGARLSDDELLVPAMQDNVNHLLAVNVESGATALMTPGGIDSVRPNISPDRSQFVYSVGQPKDGLRPRVADVEMEGGKNHFLLTSLDRPCATAMRPSWSADGKQLAIVCAEKRRGAGLFIIGPDGAEISNPLPDDGGALGPPSWGTNGLIALWSGSTYGGEEEGGHLIAVDPDQPGPPTELTTGTDAHPSWFGDDLLFVRYGPGADGEDTIMILHDAAGAPEPIIKGDVDSPTWSPDGQQIAYRERSADGGPWQLWVADADGGNQFHIELDAQDIGAPTWAPR